MQQKLSIDNQPRVDRNLLESWPQGAPTYAKSWNVLAADERPRLSSQPEQRRHRVDGARSLLSATTTNPPEAFAVLYVQFVMPSVPNCSYIAQCSNFAFHKHKKNKTYCFTRDTVKIQKNCNLKMACSSLRYYTTVCNVSIFQSGFNETWCGGSTSSLHI